MAHTYTIAIILGLAILLASCAGTSPDDTTETLPEQTVQTGDVVSVEYTGTFENGTVFDTSEGRGPLNVQVGQGQVIPGFENALVGMSVGETKTITLPPEDAYGYYNESRITRQAVPAENFPENVSEQIGETIVVTNAMGQPFQAFVVNVSESNVTLDIDTNHPLAGETLVFDVRVVEIGEAPPVSVE